jgi:hypothetical protein
MSRRPSQHAEDTSTADARIAVSKTWFGTTLLRATALVVLIASYLAAIGVVLRFFSNEFHAFKAQEPLLFWLLLAFPLLFIGCFSIAPEAWRRFQLARRNALALKEPELSATPLSSYFRLDPYVTSAAADFKREDDAHGRVLRWLRASTHPVMFLSGVSGSGKSSILEAYAVPLLREQEWRVEVVRTFSAPLAAFEAALAARRPRTTRLLIVLDQFEEFVILEERSSVEERQTFLQRLRDIRVNPPPNVGVLIVVRSDYLNALIGMKLDDLTSDKTWLEIDPFRRGPARRFLENAPRKPAPELVDRLLDGADALDDTPGLFKPVVLNMLGLALDEFDQAVTRRPERLVQEYLERAVKQTGIREIAPAIIGKMISDKGTKYPRSIDELKRDTALTETEISFCLIRLEAKRLVRRLAADQGLWEISHDFVARQLGLLLGRLRPSRWLAIATWTAPVLLGVVLAFTVFGVPIYIRQHASQELRRQGVQVTGSDALEVRVPPGKVAE